MNSDTFIRKTDAFSIISVRSFRTTSKIYDRDGIDDGSDINHVEVARWR